ncbi:hypothetical protein E5D57_013762 [Metarhizium anisopliae]|nr:hypothetical protein E5D57_013762 [Metarhizium anisopliae]
MSTDGDSMPPTNGDIIKLLQALRAENEFGVLSEGEDEQILRQIYSPLKSRFCRTCKGSKTSSVNYGKIQKIDCRKDLEKVSSNFARWQLNPLEFWERPVLEPLKYSDVSNNRARYFVLSAAKLDSQITDQEILQRFVAIEIYALFKRVSEEHSTYVTDDRVGFFLRRLGLPVSEEKVKTYGNIIRRGKKVVSFCKKLMQSERSDGFDGDENEDIIAIDYGALFLPSLPNSMWDTYGLVGEDQKHAIQHLRKIGIIEAAKATGADNMARDLLKFHQKILWMPNIGSGSSKRGANQCQTGGNSKRPRIEFAPNEVNTQPLEVDDSGRFLENSCDTRQLIALASAACATEAGFSLQSGERRDPPNPLPIDQQVYSDAASLSHLNASPGDLSHPNGPGNAPSLSIEELLQPLGTDNFVGVPSLSIEELLQPLCADNFVGPPLLSIDALLQNSEMNCEVQDVPSGSVATSGWPLP